MKSVQQTIIDFLGSQESASALELAQHSGVSRQYASRILKSLREDGRVVLAGSADRARWALARPGVANKLKKSVWDIRRTLKNQGLDEDTILAELKRDTGIFEGLSDPTEHLVSYAFSEMLNNAIDHSKSKTIALEMKRDKNIVRFSVTDHGIGIFNNLIEKRGLKSEREAVQDLLKGKQTTAPERHSGEGIFFTSKAADTFTIRSGNTVLTYANLLPDLFVETKPRARAGTQVVFVLSVHSQKNIRDIFEQYASESYEFDKTTVVVKLYKLGSTPLSRSQARRLLSGLEKFKVVVLDFAQVPNVGQAFVHEVFEVWARQHSGVALKVENANGNIQFMLEHVLGKDSI